MTATGQGRPRPGTAPPSQRLKQHGMRALAHGLPNGVHHSLDTQADQAHAVSPAALAPLLDGFFAG